MAKEYESNIKVIEQDNASKGTDPDEVLIAISPAFGTKIKKNIVDIGLDEIIKELCAGIEEEGMKYRIIKVYDSTDLALITSQASKLSGSGISIGLQSRGTTEIHQRDLVALDNLELFPQSPLLTKAMYRKIGKNAAKYAKGENPEPVEALNDFMAPSKYVVKSTLFHFKEHEMMDESRKPINVEIVF